MLNMQSRIVDTFRAGAPKVVPYKAFGLELEYEGLDWHDVGGLPSLWMCTEEASLRGGVEFLSNGPIRFSKELSKALEQLDDIIDTYIPKATKRCGLHVHWNLSHCTWWEFFRFMTLYALVEPVIFHKFAPGREESHFCVPLWANTYLQKSLYEDGVALRKGVQVQNAPPKTAHEKMMQDVYFAAHGQNISKRSKVPLSMWGDAKYSALNIRPLAQFGTVEFRMPESTTKTYTIMEFVKFINRLYMMSKRFASPELIIAEWEANGYKYLAPRLGLAESTVTRCDVSYLEDAQDAAILVAGHEPVRHTDLEWEF